MSEKLMEKYSDVFVGEDEALELVKRGEILIVVDREDRENEGDLFVAGEMIDAEKVNFMIREGRGLVCVPISEERALELGLNKMIEDSKNEEFTKCKFTIPVDAKDCKGSGISAFDRALTISKLADFSVGREHFIVPGHVFPLIAEKGGLKVRDGHTEAAVYLSERAGFSKCGVICEIIGDDGEMLRGKGLMEFAKKWGLKVIGISSLSSNKK